MDLFEGLNPKQKEAVKTTDGPVLIFAGAGSGKTKSLVHRIAYIIQEKKLPAHKILAVTFTNKAAQEIKARVHRLLEQTTDGPILLEPSIGTFHSTALQWLRLYADKIGFDSSFSVLDSADQLNTVKQSMRDMGLDTKTYAPKAVLAAISGAKNELTSPKVFCATSTDTFSEVAGRVFIEYQRRIEEANAMDFDDLLGNCIKLFVGHPEVLETLQERYPYIMVDEYQDTNHAQYKIVTMLAEKHKNLCVIGDDWQGIYSWRGATIQNILDFEIDYPETKVIKLEQNYRSTKNILSAAQAVIEVNTNRSDKVLWTDNDPGDLIQVRIASDQYEEATTIVDDIEAVLQKDRLAEGRLTYSDFAILYRVNAQSRALEEAFVKYGIPYRLIGGVSFYGRAEIKDVLAYLRLIANPRDTVAFFRIVNVPARKIGPKSITLFREFMDGQHLSLRDALENAHLYETLGPAARAAFASFSDMMKKLRAFAQDHVVADLLTEILKLTGYKYYLDDGSDEGTERLENVNELKTVASKYNGLDPEGSLATFLAEVALVSDQDGVVEDGSAVNLLTVHSAKGLEFEYVYLPGLEETIFPHSRSLLDSAQMEEERRLCYVALTRARTKLMVLAASSRVFYGDVQRNSLSRFVEDIPPDVVEPYDPPSSGSYGLSSRRSRPTSGDFDGIDAPAAGGITFEGLDLDFDDPSKQARNPASKLSAFKHNFREKHRIRKSVIRSANDAKKAGLSAARYKPEGSRTRMGETSSEKIRNYSDNADISPATSYATGDRVRHRIFGDGVVEKTSGDMLSINFGGGVGMKTISPKVAPLDKIS